MKNSDSELFTNFAEPRGETTLIGLINAFHEPLGSVFSREIWKKKKSQTSLNDNGFLLKDTAVHINVMQNRNINI